MSASTNKEQYRAICRTRKGIPLFMQPWWLDAACAHWDVAIAHKGDQLAGTWAYPVEQKMGVTLLRTPMMTPYLGPVVFYPPDLRESKKDSFEHDTIGELLKQLPDTKVWFLALRPGLRQAGLFAAKELRPEVQQTFLVDLELPEAHLLSNIKESARKNIRQCEREMTVTDEPARVAELFRFEEKTLGAKGKKLPYTADYLKRLMTACRENDAGSLWVARQNGLIEAIIWQAWDYECSYYLAGAQNPETSGHKAMTLLLWHCIRHAKALGKKTFDLEGSMDPGVERFFRNFGGKRELYMVLRKNESMLWNLKQRLLG